MNSRITGARCVRARGAAALLVLVGAALAHPPGASAGVYHFVVPDRTEPANHYSFVRDNGVGGVGRKVVAWDDQYAQALHNLVPAGSVDVIMQQCFGGGFINDFVKDGPDNGTIATASYFDECALNADRVIAANTLDNFTRAYRDAARGRPAQGVLDWWNHAAIGGDGIAKDPYAVPNGGANTERPWYFTTDNEPPNTNNTRTFTHDGAAGGSEQFAILVAWNNPQFRHMVNLQRMYWMLRNDFGVPFGNIVVLWSNSTLNTMFPTFNHVDPLIPDSPLFLDGPSKQADWLAALQGKRFSTGGTLGTNVPDANDKLLIYNTGHGGHGIQKDGVFMTQGGANVVGTDAPLDLAADGMNFAFAPGTPEASTIMNEGAGNTILIQLLLRQQINADAVINMPGVGMVTAGSALLLDLGEAYLYNGAIDETTYAYQFSVDQPTLAAVASGFELFIEDLDAPFVNDNLIAALTFIGGDQEHVYLTAAPVPEPSALLLLAGGGAMMMIRRRRR